MHHHTIRLALALLLGHVLGWGAEYHVAPAGSDAADGSQAAPFATVQRAQQAAQPGDTVLLRGGTYRLGEAQIARRQGLFASVILLDKSGTRAAPIRYWAYPGERPVLDFSAISLAEQRVLAVHVTGSWLHLRGFEIVGVQVAMRGHTQSECIENQGSSNVLAVRLVSPPGSVMLEIVALQDDVINAADGGIEPAPR